MCSKTGDLALDSIAPFAHKRPRLPNSLPLRVCTTSKTTAQVQKKGIAEPA